METAKLLNSKGPHYFTGTFFRFFPLMLFHNSSRDHVMLVLWTGLRIAPSVGQLIFRGSGPMSKTITNKALVAALALSLGAGANGAFAEGENNPENMSFFITSTGSGQGANFGGLEGADVHCTTLAHAAGSTKKWAAYLSTSMIIDRSSGSLQITEGINARDRIGTGPWHNIKGELIATDVEALHADDVNINYETGLDENGNPINKRGERPNKHDILTGSDSHGYFSTAGGDTTCGNWTSDGEGSAIVGHHDRAGPSFARNFVSWNSSHPSRGCSDEALTSTGGAGLLYCFAVE